MTDRVSLRVVLVGPPGVTHEIRDLLEASGVSVVSEVVSPDDIPEEGTHDTVVVASSAGERDEGDEGEEAAPIEALTVREREVLELLSEGLPNKTIASRLGVSEHTVKFHLSSIFGKLGVSTRTEAVRRAVRAGLINL